MSPTNTKRKIAILGGGPSAMAAAFELTNHDGWSQEYDVTVYQLGWRLGGKGASGHNAAMRNRIEEHGLHMWMGFYENAFHVMRQVFTEIHEKGLAPDSPFQDWTDAFTGQSFSAMTEKRPDGYQFWGVTFPNFHGAPGDLTLFTDTSSQPPTPWEYIGRMLEWLLKQWKGPLRDAVNLVARDVSEWVLDVFRVVGLGVEKLVGTSLLDAANALTKAMHEDGSQHHPLQHKALVFLLREFRAATAQKVEENPIWDDLRHLYILTDFVVALIKGMIEDGVITKGFQVIDKYEMSEWLAQHGSTEYAVIMRPVYDASFAYVGGDPNKPNMSACAALHGMLRLFFSYKGYLFYHMNAGMGDTIFAPLYILLRNRGVKFEFFHKVTNLGLSKDQKTVETIAMDVQATVLPDKSGALEYHPLVPVKYLPCWPSEPLYDQLKEGDTLKKYNLESAWSPWKGTPTTLQLGKDFDQIVLGISLAALPYLCPELIKANPKWDRMVANLATVQTQAAQAWFKASRQDLGLNIDAGEGNEPTIGGYVEPFDIYADMTHLLPREEWLPGDGVKQLTYWCNCLQDVYGAPPPGTDPNWPTVQQARVLGATANYLKNSVELIYPKLLAGNGSVNWDLLADPLNGVGEARLQSQYYRANIDPSERYVLSTAGTMQYRLKSWDSGFDNLYLAGDWTDCFLNSGCVEASVISGLMASQAICGFPQHIYGGWDMTEAEPVRPWAPLNPANPPQTDETSGSDQ